GEVYLVREYIEGMSLAQMVLQKGGISEAEICRISRKICQTAEQFQNPDEPMIHRDIKPENIVVTPGGEVVFIDFGTMRSYKKDGSRDTFVVGTRGTAAPEQYGYTQTDQRTDVYAIGQTMLYMVSESYEMNQLSECAVSRRMKKIIEKACSFEPDKRYGDAAQLRRAVEKCQANNRKKVYKKAGAVFGLIAAGYILAIFSPDGTVIENKRIETAEQSAAEEQIQAEIIFREELIEEAVRKELGLSKTDKITASMLEDVRKLRIVGKEILDDEDTFWGEGRHVDGKDSSFGSVRGNITDLSDLAQMVNLEELALCNQKIEDISGLKELPLKKLYLSKNMITDFSVLLNLIDLDTLCIMENPAENLSVIGECTGILRLNIQGMNLTDIDFLKNLSLDYLDMSNVEVENNIFEPLAEMKKLDTLCMCDVNEAAAETLSQMSTLKALFMWGDSTILENLKPLKGMTQLETLAFTTQISSLEGIEQFPSLNFLSVSFSLVKDLSPVTGAKNLQVIDISNADIENFEPLFGHSGLTEVHCTEEQKEEIMKIDSSPDFEIYT
ncbi:MAG: protein kinase, partial [Blautia wexlerae]